MDGLERQQFVREQRELAARQAKKVRAELARRRAALPRGEDLLEQREGREQPRAFQAEREPDKTGMIYKTRKGIRTPPVQCSTP